MTTWAPPSTRLSKVSSAPLRFQEALRDEDAEPHVVRGAGAGRQIGLAEPADQMGGKPGPSSAISTVTFVLSQWIVTLTSLRANCTAF